MAIRVKRRKTGEKVYEVTFRVATSDGLKKRGKTFTKKAYAEAYEAQVKADKSRGQSIDPALGRTPFGKVADQWLESTPQIREKTRRGYASILRNHILPSFGRRGIDRIKPPDIQAFVNRLQAEGAQPGTVRNIYRTLVPVFKMAVQYGYIASSPCIGIKLPKAHREEMYFLTTEEVNALAEEITKGGKPHLMQYGMLVRFAAYTALRAGEIAALRVRHLDLLHRRVDVVESVADVAGRLITGPTKNYTRRTVSLPIFLATELQEYLGSRLDRSNEFVFTGSKGQQLRHNNFYGRYFRPAIERAVEKGHLPKEKQGLRFHDLRHTCAAFLIGSGAHPKDICDWLGHSSITVTMDRYGHRFPERNAELAGLLQERHLGVKVRPAAEVVSLET